MMAKLLALLVLSCLLTLGWCETGILELKEESQCAEIDSYICAEVGYNKTSFPNFLGYERTTADRVLNESLALIQSGCSNAVVHLLCSVYMPFCSEQFGLIRPCRNLCDEVKINCESVVTKVLNRLPVFLNCDARDKRGHPLYLERGNDTLCFGPEDPSQIEMPMIQGVKIRHLVTDNEVPPIVPENFIMETQGPYTIKFSWDFSGDTYSGRVTRQSENNGISDKISNSPTDYVLSCSPQMAIFPYQWSVPVNKTAGEMISITLTGFEPNTTYSCELRAYNDAGGSQEALAMARTPELLILTFTDNTPAVDAATGTVQAVFHLNRRSNNVNCLLVGLANRRDCSSGMVEFHGIATGKYTLRITVNNGKSDRLKVERAVNVVRRNRTGMCAVNHINSISYPEERTVRVEVAGVGPVEYFTCQKIVGNFRTTPVECDPNPAMKFTFNHSNDGKGIVLIRPHGEQCVERKKVPFQVEVLV